MSRLRKFWQLRGPDRRRLLVAAGTLLTVRVLLQTVGFRRARKLLDRAIPQTSRADVPINEQEMAAAVERAARALPGNTCLVQAMAAEWLIKRGGGAATLRLGVASADIGIRAHAWLESDGGIILGAREANEYIPLQR